MNGYNQAMVNTSNKTQNTGDSQSLPSPAKIFLDAPLYESIPFGDKEDGDVIEIHKYPGTLDLYCPECQQNSVFHSNPEYCSTRLSDDSQTVVNRRPFSQSNTIRPGNSPGPTGYTKLPTVGNSVFVVEFYCSRVENHRVYFCFKIHNRNLIKIGQYPSIADLNENIIKKYRKILGNEKYKELNRGIGLATHGVGIGSFVYLRRIFENLVEEAHNKAAQEGTWDEEKYKRGRMDEKIGLLSHLVPTFLSENKGIYSILSKGLHELDEKECLNYFPVLKSSIELILDEKIREAEHHKKLSETRQALASIKTNLT